MEATLVALFCWALGGASGARILGVFPHPGYSHFLVFQPLMEELAARGHQVTVLSHFPAERPPPNYTDVSAAGTVPDINNRVDITVFEDSPTTLFSNAYQLYRFLDFLEPVFRLPEVRSLAERKFDLVIVELFNSDAFLGLAYRIGAPYMAISSSNVLSWGNARFANPDEPSHVSNVFGPCYDGMDFAQRLWNAYILYFTKAAYSLFLEPYSQRLAEKYLGPLPPLSELALNTSLLLVNTHFSLHKPRPLVPGVVQVGGLHIKPPKRLPKDLEKLLNNSKDGVVYFSMGSLLRGETLSGRKRDAFLRVFSGLKQTVLWKWEADTFPDKPDNVYASKWFPQRDILGHKNVLLFISHAGLLGATEVAHCGVPTVCIPMYGDQEHNCGALVQEGVAIKLDFHQITTESLNSTVRAVLDDSNYMRNAKELSRRYRDRPMSALDTAVYWTEYVLRHGGAPRLRPAARLMPSYQYLGLDLLSFVALTLALAATLAYSAVRACCAFAARRTCAANKLKSG